MTLLIIIGIVLLLWFYVFPRLLPYLLKRQLRKTFGFDPTAFGSAQQQQQQRRQAQPQQPAHKKIIDPTVGEYVEFTETETTTHVETPEGTETTTVIEQQITDIQWEDLPPEESK